ncbi:hypothetical protein GCM10010406_39760 [Streptomyces thermolineatus]|uniref:Uncharacterized protein n=1 Tax=Streptomyces thermolineatus TaxID=44033 RepID=A0ABN3ME59_9ACTN
MPAPPGLPPHSGTALLGLVHAVLTAVRLGGYVLTDRFRTGGRHHPALILAVRNARPATDPAPDVTVDDTGSLRPRGCVEGTVPKAPTVPPRTARPPLPPRPHPAPTRKGTA